MMRASMQRACAALLMLSALSGGLLLSACGREQGPRSAAQVLADADRSLSKIDSATMDLHFAATALAEGDGGEPGSEPVGFDMSGPFSFKSEGDLPVAELDYTELRGSESTKTKFTSTGSAAFITADGNTYAVPASELGSLRLGDDSDGAGLETLELRDWVKAPKRSAGPRTDGVPTESVTGQLNVPAALGDLAALAKQLGIPDGGAVATLGQQDNDHLTAMVETSNVEIISGRSDHFLRRLEARIDFRADVPDQARASLGAYAGARLEITLSLSAPNRPVKVTAPANVKPLPAT